MNLQTRLPTTADGFLRWNEGRVGKWDLVDGRIVDMMVPEMIEGLAETLSLPGLGIALLMDRLYAGVGR